MMIRSSLLALALAAPSGCEQAFGDGRLDPHSPGSDLGTFHVDGALTSNTCGPGAFGAVPSWSFDVKLLRNENTLYWNNGQEIIPGILAADLVSFTFDTGVVVNMRAEEEVWLPPCSVRRLDHATGTLSSASDDVASFTGQIDYRFDVTSGSTCDDLWDGPEPIVLGLPCTLSYSLQGARTGP